MLDQYVRGVAPGGNKYYYSKMIAEKDRVMKKKILEREREREINH